MADTYVTARIGSVLLPWATRLCNMLADTLNLYSPPRPETGSTELELGLLVSLAVGVLITMTRYLLQPVFAFIYNVCFQSMYFFWGGDVIPQGQIQAGPPPPSSPAPLSSTLLPKAGDRP